MPDWRLGTMGFGYPEWANVFYPSGMKAGDYLELYAKHFDSVELDTTFHATPLPQRVRRWADVTPEHFRFSAKVPKSITHEQSLDKGLVAMHEFLETMQLLGTKLGVILLQFPPSFIITQIGSLDRFLSQMPAEIDFAVEFRHISWLDNRTAEVLAKHHVAWASADYVGEKAQIVPTADFLYIRWIGEHNRFLDKNIEEVDLTDRLQWWKEQIDLATQANSIETIWGYFNNDYAGYSIATCNRFKRLIGLKVEQDCSSAQGRLF